MIYGIEPSISEFGKIKLGGLGQERQSKAGGTYRQPMKYDEFVLTKTYRDNAGNLVRDDELMKSLKRDPDGKLRSIPIILHSDEIDEVFPTQYARYAGKKLHCSGDGQMATRWTLSKDKEGNTVRTGENSQLACPCPYLDDSTCKPHAILYCSIAVQGMAVAGAIHTLRTTSIITIRRIIGSLLQIKKTVGMLQGLPLWLVVQPVRTEKALVYCAHIELRAKDVIDAQRTAIDAAKMRRELVGEVIDLNRSYRAMLVATASPEDTDEEQSSIAEEFYPPEESLTPQPEAAPQTQTAKLLNERKRKNASSDVIDKPADIVDPKTGEVLNAAPLPNMDAALDAISASIATAKTLEELVSVWDVAEKKLTAPDKIIARKLLTARREEMSAKGHREPGED